MHKTQVSSGIDTNYVLSKENEKTIKREATVQGRGATAVVAALGLTSNTITTDTVNLSTDLNNILAGSSNASLTASLAQALKGASHVDYATGAREINQDVGDTLASQVGQLLVGSGFSQAAAAKASASLVQQFTSASPTTSAIALSLVNQDQSSGTYNSKVSSGTEASAYSVKTPQN